MQRGRRRISIAEWRSRASALCAVDGEQRRGREEEQEVMDTLWFGKRRVSRSPRCLDVQPRCGCWDNMNAGRVAVVRLVVVK